MLSCLELLQPEDTVPTSVLCGAGQEKTLGSPAGPTVHTAVPLILPLYTFQVFLLLSLINTVLLQCTHFECTLILHVHCKCN